MTSSLPPLYPKKRLGRRDSVKESRVPFVTIEEKLSKQSKELTLPLFSPKEKKHLLRARMVDSVNEAMLTASTVIVRLEESRKRDEAKDENKHDKRVHFDPNVVVHLFPRQEHIENPWLTLYIPVLAGNASAWI